MTATCKTMMPAIGANIIVRFESVHINCVVRDVKNSYGQARVQIEPVSGSGSQWVEMSRIVNPERSTVKVECCPGERFHSSNCPMIR